MVQSFLSPPSTPNFPAGERFRRRLSLPARQPSSDKPSPLKVFLPLTNQERFLVQQILSRSKAFAVKTVGDQTRPVEIEWVMLPSMEEPINEDMRDYEDARSDFDGDAHFENPSTLEEKWEYLFEEGQDVWVKGKTGAWMRGKITCASAKIMLDRIGEDHVAYYPVDYGRRYTFRGMYAPMNGDVKPDTVGVRKLLRKAGWLMTL